MSRSSRYALLAVLGAGVFLAGLELMITAVALPSILLDLAVTDQLGKPPSPSSATRRGSSTATCSPTSSRCRWRAGWPTSGARAGCSSARSSCSRRVARSPAAAQTLDELIAGRIVQGIGGGDPRAGRDGGGVAPVRGPRPAAGARVIGALTFLGMAAGPFLGAAILGGLNVDGGARAGSASPPGSALHDAARAGLALGLLRQRPDRDRRPARRLGGVGRLGDAAPARRRRRRRRGRLERRPGGGARRDDADRRRRRRRARTRCSVGAALAAVAVVATLLTIVRGLRRPDPFLDPRLFRSADLLVGGARLAADRLRVRDRDHRRRGVRRPRPLRRPGRSSGSPSGALAGRDGASGRSSRASRSASCRSGS